MRNFVIAGLFLMAASPSVAAESGLRVSTSILPVQALARAVMQDPASPGATPDLILPPGASPHSYALKPSEARALAAADVVFRVGPQLEAFLDRPLANLATGAIRIDLINTPGLTLLPLREDEDYQHHDHGDHDDHDDHENETHAGHESGHDDDHADEHEHEHEDEHEHDGDAPEHVDPHIWLHPGNAIAMVRHIAEVLSDADPEHAALYRANATRTIAGLQDAATRFEADWQARRAAHEAVPFVVFHDSLHYFEHWSGIQSSGSITLNPEVPPGARHMQELRERMASGKVRCVFIEPQLDGRIARQIAQDAELSVHVVDPLGSTNARATAGDGTGGFKTLVDGIRKAIDACEAPFRD